MLPVMWPLAIEPEIVPANWLWPVKLPSCAMAAVYVGVALMVEKPGAVTVAFGCVWA